MNFYNFQSQLVKFYPVKTWLELDPRTRLELRRFLKKCYAQHLTWRPSKVSNEKFLPRLWLPFRKIHLLVWISKNQLRPSKKKVNGKRKSIFFCCFSFNIRGLSFRFVTVTFLLRWEKAAHTHTKYLVQLA